jgi:hypothetical protein
VRWQQANSRGFEDSILPSAHQGSDWEFRIKLSWCGEPLSLAACKALVPTEGDWSPLGNTGELTCSRPAAAAPKKTARSAQRVVSWLFGYLDWGFPCFSSVVRQMPGHNSKGARPASPITEAFSRSESPPPNHSGLQPKRPQHFSAQLPEKPSNQNRFDKGQVLWWGNPPLSAVSLVWQVNAFRHDKTPLA